MSDDRLAAIEQKIDRLVTGQDQLQTDVRGLQTDVRGLQTDVRGLQTDVYGLQTSVTQVQADVVTLQRDVSQLQSGQEELQAGQELLHRQFARLETRVDSLDRHVHVLYEDVIDRIAALPTDVPTRDEMHRALAELNESIGRRLDPLEAAVRRLM